MIVFSICDIINLSGSFFISFILAAQYSLSNHWKSVAEDLEVPRQIQEAKANVTFRKIVKFMEINHLFTWLFTKIVWKTGEILSITEMICDENLHQMH